MLILWPKNLAYKILLRSLKALQDFILQGFIFLRGIYEFESCYI